MGSAPASSTSPIASPSGIRRWAELGTMLALFFLLVFGSVLWSASSGNVLAVWPANGVLLGYLLARPGPAATPLLLAGFIANAGARLFAGEAPLAAMALGAINLTEIGIALALAHQRFGRLARPDLRETSELNFFLARICVLASAPAAVLAAGFLWFSAATPFPMTLLVHWLGGFLGLALVGVLTVELLHPAFLASAKLLSRLARLGWVIAACAAIAWVIFSQTRYPLLYLFGPVMMAAAYGTGLRGAAAGILSIAAVATWLTAAGTGPLALIPDSSAAERMLSLQVFLLVGAVIILPVISVLSMVVRQRVESQKVLTKMMAIMTTAPIGIIFTRDRRFELVSATFESMFGYPKNGMVGELARIIYESDEFYAGLGTRVGAAFKAHLPFTEELHFVRQDGSRFWGLMQGAPVRADDPSAGTIWIVEDVTESREMQKRLSWASTHDPLTELVNRREFGARVDDWLRTRNEEIRASSLFIDLDRFKAVNDTAGHGAGDQILKDVAGILRQNVRDGDTVARFGGDEFAVLLLNCSAEVGERIANKICQAVEAHRLEWEGLQLGVGASVGLVDIDERFKNVADVIAAADRACYDAKRAGRNTVRRG